MRIAIFALVIAYLIALIGLLRKERDPISAVLAIFLTAGLVAGILKENARPPSPLTATARAEDDRRNSTRKTGLIARNETQNGTAEKWSF